MPHRVPASLHFVVAAVVVALTWGASFASAQEQGTLRVRVSEQGRPLPVRAWVAVGNERHFTPAEPAGCTPYPRDRSFSCDGSFTMKVAAGKAVVHLERGKEYRPLDHSVSVAPGQTLDLELGLERWIDLPAEGFYSADMHVHLGQDDPRILTQLALADDVHLVPAFTYWLRGRGETWQPRWPAGVDLQPLVIDARHLVTRNNIEVERIRAESAPGASIGATFLFQLEQPVVADSYGEHFPASVALSRAAHRHSPALVIDSDKPSWAETVVDVALGEIDTIQVCHNHYHRLATIPGGFGMIGPLEAGESNAAVGDGLFHRTNALYYRFLNCGFRLGVSGGSAIGVMPVPTGFSRVYAKIDGPLSTEKMWSAIKAGRTFATSGPILTITADGQPMGEMLTRPADDRKPVSVAARLRSIEPIESLEIVHDGRVVSSADLRTKPVAKVLDETASVALSIEHSGWVVARALYRAPDGLLRQAHTSPVYISVAGRPYANAGDVRYMLRWIDVLEAIATKEPTRFPTAADRNAVLALYAEARDAYRGRLRE